MAASARRGPRFDVRHLPVRSVTAIAGALLLALGVASKGEGQTSQTAAKPGQLPEDMNRLPLP